jgi:hypothetical protein
MTTRLRRVWRLSALVLLAALWLAGCGGDTGPTLYPLSGEVTYMGKPVKAGTMHFEPAGGKADPRAITIAEIRAGRYELPKGKGVMGGPYTVIISPCDGIPREEEPMGKLLIQKPHVAKVDLPKEASTKNFVIPR